MPGIADDLAESGFSLRRDFLDERTVTALCGEALALLGAGAFDRAGVGRGASRRVAEDIRADFIHWLDRDLPTEPQRVYWESLDALRDELNRELYLGIRSVEAHFAHYPPGGFYRRHVDRFRDEDTRVVSAVLYLVDAWGEEDGGQLVLYASEEDERPAATVTPERGLLACFLSRTVPHEVLHTRRDRLSLTAWMRDA